MGGLPPQNVLAGRTPLATLAALVADAAVLTAARDLLPARRRRHSSPMAASRNSRLCCSSAMSSPNARL